MRDYILESSHLPRRKKSQCHINSLASFQTEQMILNSKTTTSKQTHPHTLEHLMLVTQTHGAVGYHSSPDQEPESPLQNIVQFENSGMSEAKEGRETR